MGALDKNNVCLTRAKVYVARLDDSIPELASDFSNAEEVITACKAMITWETPLAVRMASVIDTKLTVGKGTEIKVEADDTGLIVNDNTPEVKVGGSFYEAKNVDAIAKFLNISVVDVTGTPNKKIFGQKIEAQSVPSCVLILEWINESGKQEYVFLVDASYTSEFVLSFIDYVRAGSVEASPFEFSVNKYGWYLVEREISE